MSWREFTKTMLNAFAGRFGARLVGAGWGPRGVWSALERVKALGFTPGSVADVGAADGQWTQRCRKIFPEAAYLLADPLEENRGPLERLAGEDQRIHLWHGLIGAERGELALFCHGDQSSVYGSRDFSGPALTVPVRTLDEFMAEGWLSGPLLIKADVQGHEVEVLRGAQNCLKACEALVLEVSFRPCYDGGALAHEVLNFLGERGFYVYDLLSYVQRPADQNLMQGDVMFVRHDSALLSRDGWF